MAAALADLAPSHVSPFVIAAGKAAWPMFQAASDSVPIEKAIIATMTGTVVAPPPHVEVFEAGHPSPNAASVAAARRSLALARESAARGGLTLLLSGGASAMLAAPADGLTLDDKVETARTLMSAGAPIDELNCVRKHLSSIKGGRLAAAAGRSLTLALSDVHSPVPDDPSVIASGPTVPDRTTFDDALAVIRKRAETVPGRVVEHLHRGARGGVEETIKPGDPRVAQCIYRVVGNRHTAMDAARSEAERLGYAVVAIENPTAGEARVAASRFVSDAHDLLHRSPRPLCVIASGETTVTVHGNGLGGRNQEFALAAAGLLSGIDATVALASAGTDGIDGPTVAAGAIADTSTFARAKRAGVSPDAALAANDSYHFFEALGDLIVWGPTGTNVGDLHIVLIA